MATIKQLTEHVDSVIAEYEEARVHYQEERRIKPTFSVNASARLKSINEVLVVLKNIKEVISGNGTSAD